MYDSDYRIILIDLPLRIKGFSQMSPDGFVTIVLNAKLSAEEQLKTFNHEQYHIVNDDFYKGNVDQIEKSAHNI